ncbi:hypothetical protein VTL71DRAFT_8208 [Oculimacula yallundae]|uniref:Uncharacterized protein n=1 Tax=Oculimacula yallundae TaxID=86028 RepID=A0ABR4CX12_9HELO
MTISRDYTRDLTL